MLIAQSWYDNLSHKDLMKFQSDLTYSTFKRVFKDSEQVGVIISMHLRLDKPHIEDLTFQEVQMIFQQTERTLMGMVPNKLELELMGDPENQAWLLRPEARFNGASQLHKCLDDPDKVADILDNAEVVEMNVSQKQITSLIQELLMDCDEVSTNIIFSDYNTP